MKLYEEEAKINRKLLKPHIERRRRERMSRSIASLRSLLMQDPQQQGGTQRRVEKAEILEHTVLFLQTATDWDRNKAAGGGRGGRQHSFQDGFSECLQRATQFLGPQGEGERLGAALDASFAPRLARSVSAVRMDAAASCSSSSLTHMKPPSFNLQISTQTSTQGQRIALKMRNLALSRRAQLQCGYSKVARQLQSPNQPEVCRVQRITASKESQPQSLPDSHQSPWRPWP